MSNGHCNFVSVDGEECKFAVFNENKCVFHCTTKNTDDFETSFKSLIQNKNGNWKGFYFPDNFKLEDMAIDFDINAMWCRFGNCKIISVIFNNSINLSASIFQAALVIRNTQFKENVDFKDSMSLLAG